MTLLHSSVLTKKSWPSGPVCLVLSPASPAVFFPVYSTVRYTLEGNGVDFLLLSSHLANILQGCEVKVMTNARA